ncbi:MAG: DUF4127 family protein [Methanoregulaceae archaeon]|nr:DUF4127 family protein [Methanoregulaceae archaeon]
MRAKIAVGWVFAAALAPGIADAERILLIPLDSRPAAGHFAQMIGAMADVTVEMPPLDLLGRFTTPGQPERLLEWLQNQDYGDVTAVILSTDMIAYGGLIASRTDQTSLEQATQRIRALVELRRTKPGVRFYGFSAITRLTPTATKATAGWRLQLGRYAEIKERYRRTPTPALLQSMRNLLAKIPPLEIQRYDAVRDRNHELQKLLLRFTAQGIFDYMVFGQDDAQPFGPHIPETQRLRSLTNQLSVPGRVYFCEGIDQHANVLLSRALLRARNWLPRIRVVFSDEAGRKRIADYESKTVDESLRDQLFASGARPTVANQEYDYSLYLNVPKRAETPFNNFLEDLTNEIDQGFPVGVADINIAKDGTADSELFDALDQNRRLVRLLSYAGWNTAGNTMGTSIPAANVYLLARRTQTTALRRELALREFLLHRIVNDFAYHRFVRPQAYRIIDSNPKATREETYGPAFDEVNDFVRGELSRYIADTFRGQFMGQRFFAGSKQYEITALEDLRVSLPWPRAYEVRIEFKMQASEVTSIGNVSIRWPSQAVEHVLRVARRSVTDLAADWVVERP